MKKLNLNKRRFKYGTIATVITILFIAAVVLVNIVVGLLSDRFSGDIDLTTEKVFEITDQTKDFLKTLDKDIKITVLMDQSSMEQAGIAGKHVVQVIDKYRQNSDKISVQYINPDKNPEIITQFNKTYAGDLTSSLVIVQCGDKIKPIAESEMISYTQENTGSYSMSSTTEQAMTSAILTVTDDNPVVATILTTESVTDISSLTTVLNTNGFKVEETNALTGEINPDSTLLILAAPQSDLPESAVDRIAKFLDNDGKLGKSLLYISSYLQKDTPNIDALLAEYGLQAESGRVFDNDYNNIVQTSDGNYGMFVYPSSSDIYAKYVSNMKNPVFVPAPSPVTILFESKDSRETFSLLQTASSSVVIPEDADENLDITSLPASKKTILAVGSKYIYEDTDKITSNIMVLGSADLMASNWMAEASLNNSEYMLSAINVMTGKESGIMINPKSLDSTTLQVTAAQAKVIFAVTVLIIPIAIVVIAVVIWSRRKHR